MTLNEMIKTIKDENPKLQIGDEVNGYTQLVGSDYDSVIKEWAEARLAKQNKITTEEAAKASANAKLTALGLTSEEIAALKL
jgi:hypothetical protein